MQNDKRLVRRLRAGDPKAFAEFLDAFGGRVHRLVRRYVASEADAEDVTQEIFLDLYRGIGGFRGASALGTWVYRVALNHCLKQRARQHPPSEPYEDALHTQADWQADPARSAAKRELSDQVHGALDNLSPLHRDVVLLHELHGLTYQECAHVLEIPVGTVKSRLFHAFGRLRVSLSGYVLNEPMPLCSSAVEETVR